MYERFTDRARKVMQLATIEAQRLRSYELDSGHVLAGIVAEGNGLGGAALKELGVELTAVRAVLANSTESEVLAGRLPHTVELTAVLVVAIAIADRLRHHHVGTEHLLLAITRGIGCAGRMAIEACGKDPFAVEEAVMRLLEPDGLKRLVESRDPEAVKAVMASVRPGLLEELKWLDARADEIRESLKLAQRNEVLWEGDDGDHTVQIVADGYGGGELPPHGGQRQHRSRRRPLRHGRGSRESRREGSRPDARTDRTCQHPRRDAMTDLKAKYQELEKTLPLFGAAFAVHDVTTVNHKPHPFMVGAQHVAYASDHCGGRLSLDMIERSGIGCQMTEHGHKCNKPPSAHTGDRIVAVKLKRNLLGEEAQAALKEFLPCTEGDKIDGFIFVDTPEKFRVMESPDAAKV